MKTMILVSLLAVSAGASATESPLDPALVSCVQNASDFPATPPTCPAEVAGRVPGSGAPEMDAGSCRSTFTFFGTQTRGKPDPAKLADDICKFSVAPQPVAGQPAGTVPNPTPMSEAQIHRAKFALGQCLAIWHATKDLTSFVNPGGRAVASNNGNNRNGNGNQDDDQDNGNQNQNQNQNRSQGQTVGVNGMNCVGRDEHDLDFPACKKFVGWYNALQLADTGLQGYNNYQQTQAGQRGLQQAQQGLASGDTTAALAGQQTTIQERAAGLDRTMIFNGARAAAITSQLATFPNPENVDNKCGSESRTCCAVFGSLRSAGSYFPNAGMKAMMTAEIAKAVGAALAAKLAADAARRQNELVGAVKDQITDNSPQDTGLINNFCQLNPQDTRCLTNLGGVGGAGNFGSNGFTAGDFGSDSIGFDTGTSTDTALSPTDPGASSGNVGGVSDVSDAAKAAKTTFDAPSAGASIGGPSGGSGGGGGGAASAAAPGLSRDPGVQGEQKPADTKVTSLGAAYSGAAYNGSGGGRGGSDRKPASAENPFASLFGKDKNSAAEAAQIDTPASDLFSKISNRYSEVNKRKDLMEVK